MATLNNILEKVKIRGDILLGKVYGYTDRFSDLKELLLSNTFTVVPSLRFGCAQKNNADILLVIDALEVAFTNDRIDSFCIVSGDSDYTPLVGRLKSMGKFVLGISRSEAASTIFINACNEFQFLESMSTARREPGTKKPAAAEEELSDDALMKLIESVFAGQTDEDEMFASELKGVILRLRPDFNEKAFGCATFGRLLLKLSQKYGTLRVRNDNYNVMVALRATDKTDTAQTSLTRDTWQAAFRDQLVHYRDDGFTRINPSILKADIQSTFPDFTERAIGFKRFSDVLKQLEKDGVLVLEKDAQKNMLVKVL